MTSLNALIDAYEERLSSYHFLLQKIEQELAQSQDFKFIEFCECEGKRLQDLVQLCQQVLLDLRALEQQNIDDAASIEGTLITDEDSEQSE